MIWSTKGFSKMVDATDEALVLQIVQHFFPRWKDEVEKATLGECGDEGGDRDELVDEYEDDTSASTGRQSLSARGAQRGQVMTLSKTTKDFFLASEGAWGKSFSLL